MGGLSDQFWTPDERPRGHGDPNSPLGKLLVLGYPLYFVFMVGAFAGGGGFTSMNDMCPGLVDSTVQQIWGVLLTVSTLLSPLNIFWQPGLAILRFTGRGSAAYKLRSNFVGYNHETHAKHYALCGVFQAAFCVAGIVYAAVVLSSECSAFRTRAILVLLSAVSLAPFVLYKLTPCIKNKRCCPGWTAAYDAWGSKFALDCAAGHGKYAVKVGPDH